MILMDFSQVIIATIMIQLGPHTNVDIEEGLLRHMVLNSIRYNIKKFRKDFGEDFVIACDDGNYWRKDIFPYYKVHRKRDREQSEIDWNSVFQSINKIENELKEFFSYRVIKIKTAEADDVIGTLCNEYGTQLGNSNPILIISGDKDFIQLQKYSNVKQYDPVRKRWLSDTNPENFLIEHVIRGDRGDGVPSVLSDDDTFVTGKRQSPLTKKRILSIKDDLSNGIFSTNYIRNDKLINLDNIPKHIRDSVIDEYNLQTNKDNSQVFNYFIKMKLKNLMEFIGDF